MANEASEEKGETEGARDRTPLTMLVPPILLLCLAAAVGVLPHLGSVVEAAAVRFQDQGAYNSVVLFGHHVSRPTALFGAENAGVTVSDVWTGVGSATGALLLAAASLYRAKLSFFGRPIERVVGTTGPMQALQSGIVNDYVTWIVIGTACLGGALAFAIR